MTEDLEHQLTRWGSSSEPAPDGAFANQLETELRLAGADRPGLAGQRRIWQPIMAFAVAVVMVVAGGMALLGLNDSGVEVLVSSASDTQVVLPDGSIVPATAGLGLEDGSRIEVGEDGLAVVGEVVLEPGTNAVVVDGRIEVQANPTDPSPTSDVALPSTQPPQPTTSAPIGPTTTSDPTQSSTTATSRPTSTTPRPPPTTDASRPSTSAQPGTAPPTEPPQTEATSGSAPSSNVAPTDSAPPSTTPGASTTTPQVVGPVVLSAEAMAEGRVRLSWTFSPTDDLAGWEVVVTTGDRSRSLALLRDPAARTLTVEQTPGSVAVYRVTARRADGSAIAQSNPTEVGS